MHRLIAFIFFLLAVPTQAIAASWGGVAPALGAAGSVTQVSPSGERRYAVATFTSIESSVSWKYADMWGGISIAFPFPMAIQACMGGDANVFEGCPIRLIAAEVGVDAKAGSFRAGPYLGVGFLNFLSVGGRISWTPIRVGSNWSGGVLLRVSVIDIVAVHDDLTVPYTPEVDLAWKMVWQPMRK